MALFRAQGYSGHIPKVVFLLPERSAKLRETIQEVTLQALAGRENRACLLIPIGHWDEAKDAKSYSDRD